jgi:hypothetical protein
MTDTRMAPERVSNTTFFVDEQTILHNEQVMPTQSFSNPDVARLALLLPRALHGAVEQHDNKADVSARFRLPGDFCLRLGISPNDVGFYALKLFEAHVATRDFQRCHIFGSGKKSIPQPTLRLKGAAVNVLFELFGFSLTRGIESSFVRRKEIDQGHHDSTDCVEMDFSKNPDECANLNITCGRAVGIEIHDRLFK